MNNMLALGILVVSAFLIQRTEFFRSNISAMNTTN